MADDHNAPCTCRAAEQDPHPESQHSQDCAWARSAGPADSACGGCWGCINAQMAYYEYLSRQGGTDG